MDITCGVFQVSVSTGFFFVFQPANQSTSAWRQAETPPGERKRRERDDGLQNPLARLLEGMEAPGEGTISLTVQDVCVHTELSPNVRIAESLTSFRKKIKTHQFGVHLDSP